MNAEERLKLSLGARRYVEKIIAESDAVAKTRRMLAGLLASAPYLRSAPVANDNLVLRGPR